MGKLLNYEEAAEYVGVSVNTLYSMVSRRQIPHVRIGPRLVRFPQDELDAWLAERLVQPVTHAQNGGAR